MIKNSIIERAEEEGRGESSFDGIKTSKTKIG